MTISHLSQETEAETLLSKTKRTLDLAINHAWRIRKSESHWQGELLSNETITAEHIFFYQILGVPHPDADKEAYRRYLLSTQQDDGSWSIAPKYPGDVSTSAEAYLALRILGVPAECEQMRNAKAFIRQCGGVAKVRIFTRIFFAQFGLFPWKAVPQLPAEFIFFPSSLPINIYRLSSWARSTVIPLLIIRHHEKIHALPNGTNANNDFIDELWLDPANKRVPYGPSLIRPWEADPLSIFFTAVDTALHIFSSIRPLWWFRSHARKKCIQWILEHQEVEGDWAGIIPPMHAGVQALLLEGYTLEDDCVRRGIEAIERFTWQDEQGKRLHACVSPVWDTVLMMRGLSDAGVDRSDDRLRKTARWIKSRQILGKEGDWRIYNPSLEPGGFSFEYHNTWYPDVDDTAAAILALISQDRLAIDSSTVTKAANWICGMQNPDGGWAAFDLQNDKLWLNKIPFSDLNALCDPSSADVTGRILEAFGLSMKIAEDEYMDPNVLQKMATACTLAIGYLVGEQTQDGAWYGRWGSNYIYGTSNVMCGLAYFRGSKRVKTMLGSATTWLKGVQNLDGGWGEVLQSYRNPELAGQGPSTASQTAWALMGLLVTCRPRDRAIESGFAYLVATQVDDGHGGTKWNEKRYTGTGFPNFFYLGYTLYCHYFPLMAIGRYVKAIQVEDNLDDAKALTDDHDGSQPDSAYGSADADTS